MKQFEKVFMGDPRESSKGSLREGILRKPSEFCGNPCESNRILRKLGEIIREFGKSSENLGKCWKSWEIRGSLGNQGNPKQSQPWGQAWVLGKGGHIFGWKCIFNMDPNKSYQIPANPCESQGTPADPTAFSFPGVKPGSSAK